MEARKKRPAAQLSLGGAIVGGFLGIFGGAIGGTVLGAWQGNVSLGLDGAIIVGLLMAVAGALYGAILGIGQPSVDDPAAMADSATDLPSRDMEHDRANLKRHV